MAIVRIDQYNKYIDDIVAVKIHDNISVAAGGLHHGGVDIPTHGYDEVGIYIRSDASHLMQCELWWNSGNPGYFIKATRPLSSKTTQTHSSRDPIWSPSFKLVIQNQDTVAHVMSAWYCLFKKR